MIELWAVFICLACGHLWCAYIVYGYTFADFQREYPYNAVTMLEDHKKFSFKMALIGPAGFFVLGAMNGFKHGRLYPWEDKP